MEWKKEFEEKFATDIFAYSYTNYDMMYTKLKQFISTQIEKAKQEERERIVKAMTGKKLNPYKEEIQGYNDRIDDEIEIAKTLLT